MHLADGTESLEQLLGACARMTRHWPRPLGAAHPSCTVAPGSSLPPGGAATRWARASADSVRLLEGLSGVGV